jgi:ATP-dependent DNA helicase DinG
MNRVAGAVTPRLETEVLVQGTRSRQRIIEEFRDSAEASLFAVASFWQGIDVPGHSLSLVTIDRLPFAVPNDPLAEARRANADRPFYEVDLPRATMLLAQGVGRLIRNKHRPRRRRGPRHAPGPIELSLGDVPETARHEAHARSRPGTGVPS